MSSRDHDLTANSALEGLPELLRQASEMMGCPGIYQIRFNGQMLDRPQMAMMLHLASKDIAKRVPPSSAEQTAA